MPTDAETASASIPDDMESLRRQDEHCRSRILRAVVNRNPTTGPGPPDRRRRLLSNFPRLAVRPQRRTSHRLAHLGLSWWSPGAGKDDRRPPGRTRSTSRCGSVATTSRASGDGEGRTTACTFREDELRGGTIPIPTLPPPTPPQTRGVGTTEFGHSRGPRQGYSSRRRRGETSSCKSGTSTPYIPPRSAAAGALAPRADLARELGITAAYAPVTSPRHSYMAP